MTEPRSNNRLGAAQRILIETAKQEGLLDNVAFRRLVNAKAWTDAALFLVERALPNWRVRRLAFEDGAWFCALSKTWQRPDWLDESAEAIHSDLPLSILLAMHEARSNADVSVTTASNSARDTSERYTIFCDNVS